MPNDNFNPVDIFTSEDKLAKFVVPKADDKGQTTTRKKRKGKYMNDASPADEIQAAIAEEAKEAKEAEYKGYVSESPGKDTAFVVDQVVNDHKKTLYLNKRIKITFELEGGYYSMPAIDVIESQFGIMVILPAKANDVTFAPKPGSTVGLRFNDKYYDCFSPGTVFDIIALEIMVVCLIKQES